MLVPAENSYCDRGSREEGKGQNRECEGNFKGARGEREER